MPRPLNPREFVNLTVWSKLDDSNLICCSFPTNSDPPSDEFTATKGVIRGEFTWVVLLEALEGETQCKLTFWVHADVKPSIPRVLFSSVLLQSNLTLVERVLWRFARDVEVDRQSFKAWQAKLELEHDEQVQATLVLYQMKFSKRFSKVSDTGERAKRASLAEDENTRDESTPAKFGYRRKSSATKLTLFHSILLIACFALASLKMRLSSLRSAQNDDDKALAQMQIQQQRLEMVKKEKAALKEHAEALAELEKETEMLKQKRIQIEEKRATENKALADLVNEQHKQADEGNAKMGGEVRMMKSSGSLYNLLESKKKGAGGEGETSIGVIEEEEDDLEESMADGGGLISSSFKLASPNVCMSCRKKRGDLPIPHFAAASGHVDCLTHIVNTDPSSIATFDKAQRSPLFYACANNQTLTAVLLIEGAKQSRKWDVGGYKPRTNNIHNAQSRHKRRNYATTTATRHCTRAQAREAPS